MATKSVSISPAAFPALNTHNSGSRRDHAPLLSKLYGMVDSGINIILPCCCILLFLLFIKDRVEPSIQVSISSCVSMSRDLKQVHEKKQIKATTYS